MRRPPHHLAFWLLLFAWPWCAVTPAAAQTETVEYYGYDAIGSVRVVFDGAGNVLARLDYEPFGRELAPSPNAPDRKFAQLFRDGEAGLDYAQARSYQVRTGRFDAPDPVYAGLFEPQQWNRYAYAANRPLVFTDSTGLRTQEACPESEREDNVIKVTICGDAGGGGSGGGLGAFFWDSLEFTLWALGRARDGDLNAIRERLRETRITPQQVANAIESTQAAAGSAAATALGVTDVQTCISEGNGCVLAVLAVTPAGKGARLVPRASTKLLNAMRAHGRSITFAIGGSDELRFLNAMGAEASVGGPTYLHILLRDNPSKAAALEEFLHGTQARLGIIDRLGIAGAEAHVAAFMARHSRLLGLR
jgi:RHS repeat-associated protein